MSIAYSYLRFSSPEQAKGDSFRRQTQGTIDFCAKKNLVLDQTTFADKGISGFKGANRDDKAALGAFLDLARKGKIAPNSYLIIENLDRLSRENVRTALRLFLSILELQIHIVQLHPEKIFLHDETNEFDLILAIMELRRGNSESEMKSFRLGKAWAEKKARASEKKLTARCPYWLELRDGVFIVKKDRATIVERIFAEAIHGLGITSIAIKFNKEKLAPFGKARVWIPSYIAKILSNPSVIGEYQPHSRTTGVRVPVGEPVKNYYPSVVTEAQFYKAQAALKSRKVQTGTRKGGVRNLFTGILHCARTKGKLNLVSKGNGLLYLISVDSKLNGDQISFPYDAFEKALLSCMMELDPFAFEEKPDDRANLFQAQLDDINERLAKLEKELEEGENLKTLLKAVKNLEDKREQVMKDLKEARHVTNESQVLQDIQTLAKSPFLEYSDRVHLRQMIASLVDQIWCYFAKDGLRRYAHIQIHLKKGSRQIYMMAKPATSGSRVTQAEMDVKSSGSDEPIKDTIDLRQGYDSTRALMAIFPSLEMIAKGIEKEGGTVAERMAKWKKQTGRSASEYYRKLKGR